jgi:acyl carrier protein
LLLVGGDVVDPAKVRAAMIASELPAFMHTYGPTETTVFCSIQTLTMPPAEGEQLSLAPALPHARIYLVSGDGRLAPTGTVGEILVGGPCVGRGYAGRADLTAARFAPDPFGLGQGARVYRTGDLARLSAGGILEFVGRSDGQIKIRGYRVEPAEVDAALRRHPEVLTTITIGRGGRDDRRLTTYVVAANPDEPPDEESLRRHCKRMLPDYMVPTYFVLLGEIPITANGKLDHAALPAPQDPSTRVAAPREVPQGETERALAAIWSRILRVEQISRTDNFFDIGGHSLLATQVISRLREEMGVEMPLRTIFETPRLADLARAAEEARAGGGAAPQVPALVRVSREAYRAGRSTAKSGDAR